MFLRHLLFPLGIASSALTALKTYHNSNAIKRTYFGIPITLIALHQMKSTVQLSTKSILKRI